MQLFPPPYRKYFIAGLLVQVITAWFSLGYFHPDEHYQVLEFCNYKLGYSPLADLPWEYAAQCRAALQPFIAFCICKFFIAAGVYNPFIVAFCLRLLVGVLTWYTTLRLVVILLPEFITGKGRQFFAGCSFLLWFVPYFGVRFSAETISGDLFFLALSMLLAIDQMQGAKLLLHLVIAGLLLGFTLFFRLQFGFAFLGLVIWLQFIQKWNFKKYLVMATGGLLAISISICIDHWFYGNWVLTPLNYFNVNIIQHVAAKFGVAPWWYYFWKFFLVGIPPLSIVLLVLFFRGIYKKPLHLFSLVCYSFFIGHLLIGHKEMRFLFPMSIGFIFLVSVGFDQLIRLLPTRVLYKWLFGVLVTMNIVILLVKMVTPAAELIDYYKFIYYYSQKQPTIIASFNQSPFKLDVIECNFYKPNNLIIKMLKEPSELHNLLKENKNQTVIYLSRTLKPGPELNGFKVEKLYCEFPDWLLQFNINHWEDRSYIWAVYRLERE